MRLAASEKFNIEAWWMGFKQVLASAKRNLIVKPVRRLCGILPYEPIHVTSSEWEKAYAGGIWDRIGKVDQLSRYSIIAGYCHYFKPSARILDLGCGEGWQAERLDKSRYKEYLGVDISNEAISRARRLEDENTGFCCASLDDLHVDKKYDVVIFNEILYYLDDPLTTLARFMDGLASEGIMIVSMYHAGVTKQLWAAIESEYKVVDEAGMRNREGVTWYVKVLLPQD